MKGLVVKYGEKTYKVGLPDGGVTLSSCIMCAITIDSLH